MNPMKRIFTTMALLAVAASASAQTYNGILPSFTAAGSTVPYTKNQLQLDNALWGALNNGANSPSQKVYDQTITAFNNLASVVSLPDGSTPINQQAANYNQVLNQLSPGIYTTIPVILFNSANLQNTQIQQRLWAVRMGNTAGSEDVPATLNDKNSDKSVKASDKKYVAPALAPESRWLTFVDGNGMWSQGQSVNNLPGYNTYAGGVQIGASYQGVKNFTFGPYVGYQGTRVTFNGNNSGGSSAVDNSVRYGLFGEYAKGGLYIDGIVGGAYNDATVNHNISIQRFGSSWNSSANGNISGGEFDSLLGGGYEFKSGSLVFGPMTSLQYTYISLDGSQDGVRDGLRNATQEKGAGVLNQTVGAQSPSSLLYTLGAQAHYDFKLSGGRLLQPFASFAWQHEFLQNDYNLNAAIGGQSYTYQFTNPGRDQYIAAIGGNFVLNKNWSAYAVCNLVNGDMNVFSQSVSGGLNFKF